MKKLIEKLPEFETGENEAIQVFEMRKKSMEWMAFDKINEIIDVVNDMIWESEEIN